MFEPGHWAKAIASSYILQGFTSRGDSIHILMVQNLLKCPCFSHSPFHKPPSNDYVTGCEQADISSLKTRGKLPAP